MKAYEVKTQGVCARKIAFQLDDAGNIHDVKFFGGCPGNTTAIGKLIEGMPAAKVADLLRGNQCGARPTSCAAQLASGIDQALGA